MKTTRSLEVNYIGGRCQGAYLHLPHAYGARSVRSERPVSWLLVDYGRDGTPLGLDFFDACKVDKAVVDDILRWLGAEPLSPGELGPILGRPYAGEAQPRS